MINFNLFVSDELFSKYNDYLLSSDNDDDDESDNLDVQNNQNANNIINNN